MMKSQKQILEQIRILNDSLKNSKSISESSFFKLQIEVLDWVLNENEQY